MIVVKIELHPGGDASRASELGRMIVHNIGGTYRIGKYRVCLGRKGQNDRAIVERPQREGFVDNYPRISARGVGPGRGPGLPDRDQRCGRGLPARAQGRCGKGSEAGSEARVKKQGRMTGRVRFERRGVMPCEHVVNVYEVELNDGKIEWVELPYSPPMLAFKYTDKP